MQNKSETCRQSTICPRGAIASCASPILWPTSSVTRMVSDFLGDAHFPIYRQKPWSLDSKVHILHYILDANQLCMVAKGLWQAYWSASKWKVYFPTVCCKLNFAILKPSHSVENFVQSRSEIAKVAFCFPGGDQKNTINIKMSSPKHTLGYLDRFSFFRLDSKWL